MLVVQDPLEASAAVLFGRCQEVERLEAALREVKTGQGRAIMVEGEPGIGKSMLLHHVRSMARGDRMRVLSGSSEELEQRVPFAAIGRCLGIDDPAAGPQIAE